MRKEPENFHVGTYEYCYDGHKHLHPTFKELPELTPEQALITYSTMNAYSYYKYGPIEWGRIVQWLSSIPGYTPRKIEYVLRHKHMRWCADNAEDSIATLEDFQKYFERNKNDMDPKRVMRN